MKKTTAIIAVLVLYSCFLLGCALSAYYKYRTSTKTLEAVQFYQEMARKYPDDYKECEPCE